MTFSHRGDLHSEKNGSPDDPMRFIQFWILPSVRGLETRVQQRQYGWRIERTAGSRSWARPAPTAWTSRRTRERLSRTSPSVGSSSTLRAGARRLPVRDRRTASLDGDPLRTGDAAKVTGEADLDLATDVAAELILIDVPLEFEPVGVWAGD